MFVKCKSILLTSRIELFGCSKRIMRVKVIVIERNDHWYHRTAVGTYSAFDHFWWIKRGRPWNGHTAILTKINSSNYLCFLAPFELQANVQETKASGENYWGIIFPQNQVSISDRIVFIFLFSKGHKDVI